MADGDAEAGAPLVGDRVDDPGRTAVGGPPVFAAAVWSPVADAPNHRWPVTAAMVARPGQPRRSAVSRVRRVSWCASTFSLVDDVVKGNPQKRKTSRQLISMKPYSPVCRCCEAECVPGPGRGCTFSSAAHNARIRFVSSRMTGRGSARRGRVHVGVPRWLPECSASTTTAWFNRLSITFFIRVP